MVNAQEWLNKKYLTAGDKVSVKRIGPKQDLQKTIGYDLLSVFTKGRPLSTLLHSIDNMTNGNQIEDNLILEGSLSLKGFVNLESLDISNKNITALDVSDCPQLRELNCADNQLSNLDVSNNRQIEEINFSNNQLTNIDLTGLTRIEKVFCSDNKITNLEFLKSLNPAKILTLRMDNNKFPAQDLSCFTPFINLQILCISNNPFYGSLKPLRNLANLKNISIAGTDIDGGLEYLPEDFFNVNIIASATGMTGGYFRRTLSCTGKLAKQLENYKIENDPLKNYDWDAWKRDNQELINKAKDQTQTPQETEIIDLQGWEATAREVRMLNEQIQLDIYQKVQSE